MAQVKETGVKDQNTQHDHIGDDEVGELQKSSASFYQKVEEQAERFACTRFGQFAIERADRGLKLIETTTKWSLPQDKNSSGVVLERPLPWVPFLLLIIMLRLARIWLSLGALMIGNGPVSPSDMIYFIQTRRRKLRALRFAGVRVMRQRQQEASSSGAKSFIQQISQWLSRAICRPGVQRANSGRIQVTTTTQQQPNHQSQNVSKRSRDEDVEVAEHNLTLDEILNKYANEKSEDDSDFVPNAEDESESSSSENSSTNSSDDFSSNEEQENVDQYKSNNGVQHNKSESQLEKDKNKDKEQEQDQEKTGTTTTTTTTKSNGSNDKKPATETEVVKEEDWKSTPGHMSAALMKTSFYNNTAAAANIDPVQSNSNSNSTSQPEPDPETDNDSEIETDDITTTISSESESNQQIHSTIETLTPATSSEDIFYSPIGSPNNFNSCFSPMSPLQNVTINSVKTHSTPNSELEDTHSAASDLEEATRQNISLAHQGVYVDTPPQGQSQKPPQQPSHQQQPRQWRYRGRNRR